MDFDAAVEVACCGQDARGPFRRACVRIERWKVHRLTFHLALLRLATVPPPLSESCGGQAARSEPRRAGLFAGLVEDVSKGASRAGHFAGLVSIIAEGRRFAKKGKHFTKATPRAGCLAEMLRKVTNSTIFRLDGL
jgi:hypothetical protein